MFYKELEDLNNKQTQMCNLISEMKNTLEGINSRVIEVEEWINDAEGRLVEITAMEENKEKRLKRNEDSVRDLWNNIKRTKIHIIGDPEEERERAWKNICRD